MNLINKIFNLPLSAHVWKWGLLFLAIIAAIVSFSGISLHPLEAHEAFVLVTAREMYHHNDWIVPWFNDVYRLNKPPMNYWLTAFVAWVVGGINDIQPWHARFISALSAIGIVFLTVVNGRKLFDPITGLLAGLMLATSAGFFYYAHSARPEMLYAFFCGAALTFYIYVRSSSNINGLNIYGNLIWLAFALATLTKGPHLPAVFLVAFLVDCYLRQLTIKQTLATLQPFTGLLIFIAITLPWWWLLHHRVPTPALAHSQLAGSLLSIHLLKALDPYYLYRPFQLMLPWILCFPVIIYYFRDHLKKDSENLQNVFLLLSVFVLSIFILSFGAQKRWYYMLPVLMPMFILLSAGLVSYIKANLQSKRLAKYLVCFILVFPLFAVVLVNTHLVLSKDGLQQENLAKLAYEQVKSGRTLVVYNVTPQVYIFFTKHSVLYVDTHEQLMSAFEKLKSKPIALILQTKDIPNLPNNLKVSVLKDAKMGHKNKVSLININ